jgi:hypothetical protein
MANPLQTGKRSVDLAASGVRVSKIRRDPPPKVKEVTIQDRDERDRRNVIIGVISFGIALLIITIGLSSFTGWSPRQYIFHM